MPAPELNVTGQELFDELAGSHPGDDARGYPLRILLRAIGRMFEPLASLIRDSDDGPGWSAIVDPQRTPQPGWTAQLNGVVLTKGASDTQQRAEIENAAGLQRGGVPQLEGAVKTTLDPPDTAAVTIIEQYLTDYGVLVVTYTSQTPNPALTERVAIDYIPAWLLPTVRVDPGWSVGQFEAAYNGQTIADAEADFATVNDLETEIPSA